MRISRAILTVAAAVTIGTGALLVNSPARAGGHGGWGWGGPRLSFSFGLPLYYPYYAPRYYPRPYYPPYVYGAPSYPPYAYAPPNYQGYPPSGPYPSNGYYPPQNGYSTPNSYPPPPPPDSMQQSNQPQQQTWYYCDNPQGYYPDVETCNDQWRPVPGSPSGPAGQPPQ